jgi:tetratricopeptide (TPR) repeat protein
MRYLIILLSFFVILEPGSAARGWLKVTTPNFELYTSGGQGNAKRTILYFERVRTFFIQSMQQEPDENDRVLVVAFRSPKEFKPYQRHRSSAAFYLKGRDRDHIVMGGMGTEYEDTAVHEFVHLLVARSGTKLPLWLNEGLAELYSNLEPQGKNVLVGNMIPGRVQRLRETQWIPLETLTAADQDSSLYNKGSEVGIFYAQSWFLTHMLALSEDYRPKFDKFIVALAKGATAAEAFSAAYDKNLFQVEDDLHTYWRGTLRMAVFPFKLEKSAENPVVEEADSLDVELMQAGILARIDKTEEADRRYAAYVAARPDDPRAEEGLGYRYWRANDRELARQHFARAVELGSVNERMYFEYAMLRRETGAEDEELIPLLEKAVEIEPGYKEARIYLGHCLLRTRDHVRALQHFAQIKNVSAERAVTLFHGIAQAYLMAGDLEAAMPAANRALESARTPEDVTRANQLLTHLNRVREYEEVRQQNATLREQAMTAPRTVVAPSTGTERPSLTREYRPPAPEATAPPPNEPPVRVEGSLQSVDCLGARARLNVFAAGKRLALAIYDPNNIVLKGTNGAPAELNCAHNKLTPITIEYVPRVDAELGTVGAIKAIEFE